MGASPRLWPDGAGPPSKSARIIFISNAISPDLLRRAAHIGAGQRQRLQGHRAPQLRTAGDVSGLVEHAGDDQRRPGAAAHPIGVNLDPGLPWPRKRRVGSGGCQPGGGSAFDAALGLVQRRIQVAGRLRPPLALIVFLQLRDLTRSPRRVADQGRLDAVPCLGACCGGSARSASSCAASSRAMLARSSVCTVSADTMRPAARSASLSSMASSHPVGSGREVVSS